MLIRSSLIAASVVAAIGFSSPAFAQSFSNSMGTGNSLPTYYDANGALQHGAAPIAPQRSFAATPGRGLYAHHPLPGGRVWKRD